MPHQFDLGRDVQPSDYSEGSARMIPAFDGRHFDTAHAESIQAFYDLHNLYLNETE